MIKLIILDRDGVINKDSPNYIRSPNDFHFIEGSAKAIVCLNQAGFKVAVATNQSGIARGYFEVATLELIHHKMVAELAKIKGHIDLIAFCPHHPDAVCKCRKPKPGLLQLIGNTLKIDLTQAIMIGDHKRDIEAAFAVGAKGYFIHPQLISPFAEVPVFKNLAEAVEHLLTYG